MSASFVDQATGVLLAGGQSTRLGRDKSLIDLGGRPLYLAPLGVLRACFRNILVSAPTSWPGELQDGERLVPDAMPGRGPLGGLETVLAETPAPWVFLLAVDMPFYSEGLARRLAARRGGSVIVAVRSPRGLEPLGAFYHRSLLGAVRARLAEGRRSLHGFLETSAGVTLVDEEDAGISGESPSPFENVNTPEDYQRAQAMIGRGQPPEDLSR